MHTCVGLSTFSIHVTYSGIKKHYNLPPVLAIYEMDEVIVLVLFSDYTVWHKMFRILITLYYSLLFFVITSQPVLLLRLLKHKDDN